MIIYDVKAGAQLDDVISDMIAARKRHFQTIVCEFNGLELKAAFGMTHKKIASNYYKKRAEKRTQYLASAEYLVDQEKLKEYRRKEAGRKVALSEILQIAPKTMTIRDQEAYEEILRVQTSPYSKAIIKVASQWARIMEYRISLGITLEDCAESSLSIADDEGLTGSMYGMSVSFLSQVWVHGEELRQWHNRTYGVESKTGVVNPAVIVMR